MHGAAGAGRTVLDGKGSPRDGWCFDVQSDRAIVDGFTITRFGGGVRFGHGEGTSAVVQNCVIVRNAGPGIFFNHGGCAKNCTVAYNGGAGLYAYDMGSGGDDPANLILFGNGRGFVRQSANISLRNSCTADPRFVSDKDFRLRPDSPCIDAGRVGAEAGGRSPGWAIAKAAVPEEAAAVAKWARKWRRSIASPPVAKGIPFPKLPHSTHRGGAMPIRGREGNAADNAEEQRTQRGKGPSRRAARMPRPYAVGSPRWSGRGRGSEASFALRSSACGVNRLLPSGSRKPPARPLRSGSAVPVVGGPRRWPRRRG